jgi:hypothetical protein
MANMRECSFLKDKCGVRERVTKAKRPRQHRMLWGGNLRVRSRRLAAHGRETCEDSHVTAVARTSKDSFEAASTGQKTQYYVGVVKDKRTGKNGLEFLIVWREYPTLT